VSEAQRPKEDLSNEIEKGLERLISELKRDRGDLSGEVRAVIPDEVKRGREALEKAIESTEKLKRGVRAAD
jgi:hypothetical protein